MAARGHARALLIAASIASSAAPSQAQPAAATQAQPAKPTPTPATPAQPATPPAQAAPAAAPPAPTAPPSAAATPPAQEAYTYRSEGRRDPFLNLLGTGPQGKVTSRRNEGPGGLSVGEISVRGVMQSRGALVAMIEGPDKKTFIVHQGDKLLDGTIKSITPQGLVVVQEVNDPLSLIKQREIRKLLRSLEDAKE